MKNSLILLTAGLAIGAAIAWYFFPRYKTQTETKIVTEYKNRIVERIVKQPDGTTIIDRTTEQTGKATAKQSKSAEKLWSVAITAETIYNRLEPVYGLEISRTLVGPVFAMIQANTKQEITVGIGLEF